MPEALKERNMWQHRGLKNLPVLGKKIYTLLQKISTSTRCPDNIENIESICGLLIKRLQEEGLSDSGSDFLLDHGPVIQQRIKDEQLRNMVPWG